MDMLQKLLLEIAEHNRLLKKISLQNGLIFKKMKGFDHRLKGLEETIGEIHFNLGLGQELTMPEPKIPWLTIELGRYMNDSKSLINALKDGGYILSELVGKFLRSSSFGFYGQAIDIELVLLCPYNLGFSTQTRLKAIYKKANQMGYKTCPMEVGPVLRLCLPDQSEAEINVAMRAVNLPDEDPDALLIFSLENDGQYMSLGFNDGDRDVFYNPDQLFVFAVEPKNQQV